MQEQSSLEGMEWRERILNLCKASLYDAAFSSSYYNARRLKAFAPPPPAIDIQEIFPMASAIDIEVAMAAAKRLDAATGQFADYFCSPSAPENLMEALEKLHPGFSEASYNSVLGRAQYSAIK